MVDFAAQVDAWCQASEARMTAIFRESLQRTVSIAQRLVPVDTGFLRASVRASSQSMPSEGDGGDVTSVIARARAGDVIYVGYTANYAVFVEYGTSRMDAQPFVRPAVEQWPQTVARVIEELKDRVNA